MIQRITPEEVNNSIERGEYILPLDVRRASWDESNVKIKGALRIHPDEVINHLDELPKGKLIVTYCT
ncbi:MAG: hypothetical protein ABFD54_06290 [Armatimonadota bacterium]|nr:hypothetical protein [bacterium]